MKTNKIILIAMIATSLGYSSAFASSLSSKFPQTTLFECETDDGEVITVMQKHFRITETTVEAFGSQFTGYGPSQNEIIVSDINAPYGAPMTLHFVQKNLGEFPVSVNVHLNGGRAPMQYDLSCQEI